MEGSELEQWETGLTVGSVTANEHGTITIGNDECCVEVELDFDGLAYGEMILHHDHDEDGNCVDHPICFAWRYPNMN